MEEFDIAIEQESKWFGNSTLQEKLPFLKYPSRCVTSEKHLYATGKGICSVSL